MRSDATTAATFQPFLHDRVITVAAPTLVVSGPDGQIGADAPIGAPRQSSPDGLFVSDRRLLSRLVIGVRGLNVAPIQSRLLDAGRARFLSVVRGLGETTPDPVGTITRTRHVDEGGFIEDVEMSNPGIQQVTAVLEISAGADADSMGSVKAGEAGGNIPAHAEEDGLSWAGPNGRSSLSLTPAPTHVDASDGLLIWIVELPPGATWHGRLRVDGLLAQPPLFAGTGPAAPWAPPEVRATDRRLAPLLARALDDLQTLLLTDRSGAAEDGQADRFLAAGAPWYLTLFGRDSLWAARMLLPLGTDIAAETLQVLARRQGRGDDPVTGEEPGKILHEVRLPVAAGGRPAHGLPPSYYGTVDATALWLVLLHEAWCWGLPEDRIEPLLDAAEAAAGWVQHAAALDPAGFLRYVDHSGRGLANQGWRDSSDSIRWTNGQLASAPIALGEVQAYAYQAAVGTAALLNHFGRPGADQWTEWAEGLRARYHAAFWVDGDGHPYPATALDGDGGRVDSRTSSLGHLLGTGILDVDQAAEVATHLADPDLNSGFGLHTLARDSVGFNPLGYHTGSIWPHDSLIGAYGLWREGHDNEAWSIIDGVVAAAGYFDNRLPELYAGLGPDIGPAPYPASCRPQAWSAAATVLALSALAGLDPDVPAGRLHVRPLRHAGALHVTGFKVADQPVSVCIGEDGTVEVQAPAGLEIIVGQGVGAPDP
jgi:N-terminal domain of (some) glycogen debranching enzymes